MHDLFVGEKDGERSWELQSECDVEYWFVHDLFQIFDVGALVWIVVGGDGHVIFVDVVANLGGKIQEILLVLHGG